MGSTHFQIYLESTFSGYCRPVTFAMSCGRYDVGIYVIRRNVEFELFPYGRVDLLAVPGWTGEEDPGWAFDLVNRGVVLQSDYRR